MQSKQFIVILFLSLLATPSSLSAKDSPETLAWVQRLGVKIENTMRDAIVSNDLSNILVKLMECHDEFDAIALVGLHCHEARIAAELGRNYCNWMNTYTKDKDLNACIIRAQEAREQAHRMVASAVECSQEKAIEPAVNTEPATASSISLVHTIHIEADAIAKHLDAANSARSHVDFYFQLEQAYRLFADLAHLTATLEHCSATHLATSNGMNECLLAILSKTNQEGQAHIREAQNALGLLKREANRCK